MEKNAGTYLKLFSSTFYISAFTFGGGYVIIPLMKKKFAEDLKWITEDEILDLIAIAQSSPGPVAVNASLLIGYKVAGFAGAVTTVFGTILPPLIILSVISAFYDAFIANRVIAFATRACGALRR
jgi:chromate transporter